MSGTIDEVIKTAAVALATAAYRIRDIDARETWRDDAMQTIAKALDRTWKAPTVAAGDVRPEWIDGPEADLWSIVNEDDEDLRGRAARDYLAALRARLAELPALAAPSRQDDAVEEAECLAALADHPLVIEVWDEREDGNGIRVILHAGARFAERHRSDVDDMNRFPTARDALVAVVLATAA